MPLVFKIVLSVKMAFEWVIGRGSCFWKIQPCVQKLRMKALNLSKGVNKVKCSYHFQCGLHTRLN